MDDDIRRSQVVGPFGVGSMRVRVGGTSMICSSLDYWYNRDFQLGNANKKLDFESVKIINEIRLINNLGVDFFLPPPRWDKSENSLLAFVPLPFFRFPSFEYCSNTTCGIISQKKLTDTQNFSYCKTCERNGKKYIRTPQMNMITVCKNGHLDDFPWFEWAHSMSFNNNCDKRDVIKNNKLKFSQTSDVGIAGQKVMCLNCNSYRNLANSYDLTQQIRDFKCQGNRPWLGIGHNEVCNEKPEARFRTASSVYYPLTRSALYIPINDKKEIVNIFHHLENDQVINREILQLKNFFDDEANDKEIGFDKAKEKLLNPDSNSRDFLTKYFCDKLEKPILEELREKGFEEEDIIEATIKKITGEIKYDSDEDESSSETFQSLKFQEYHSLNKDRDSEFLVTKKSDLSRYSSIIREVVEDIVLVEKLTETRAFYGFARLNNEKSVDDSIKNIRVSEPKKNENWLPATQHHGEGIFINFKESELNKRLDSTIIDERIEALKAQQINGNDVIDKFREYEVSKSFIFIHTFSHLLINELIYDSGYSAASIAERIFVNYEDSNKEDMQGLLIYTSAGDSEGTMGGLVRLGEPEFFNKIFVNALRKALWCSTDPVCNETPRQGPFGLNQGACYSCCLLPETSCEVTNTFLDRGFVVGTQSNPDIGVFNL